MRGTLRQTLGGATAALLFAAVGLTAVTALVATDARPAGALVTITVTNTTDDDPGSLRAAVVVANATDDEVEIVIPASVGDIALTTGQVHYTGGGGAGGHSLTITGNGQTITQTTANHRVLASTSTGTFAVSALTVTGGFEDTGGGLYSEGGHLVVTNSTITDNEAGGNSGTGGIFAGGSAMIVNTTVSDNTGGAAGIGGIRAGSATIIGSTVNGNTAGGFGGVASTALVTIVNSTVSGNTGGVAGGVNALSVELVYTTVAGNTGAADASNVNGDNFTSFGSVVALPLGGVGNCGLNMTTTSLGHNWSDDDTCDFPEPTDHSDAGDAELGALDPNGGPTLTRAPAATSGLVNDIPAASCGDGDALAGFAVTTDQRGDPRPDPVGGACDIGAVELQAAAPPSPVDLVPRFVG